MGVLDEAIREHLELKRRRGADSGEVARQEREALGAVNRPGAAEHAVSSAPEHADVRAPAGHAALEDDATRIVEPGSPIDEQPSSHELSPTRPVEPSSDEPIRSSAAHDPPFGYEPAAPEPPAYASEAPPVRAHEPAPHPAEPPVRASEPSPHPAEPPVRAPEPSPHPAEPPVRAPEPSPAARDTTPAYQPAPIEPDPPAAPPPESPQGAPPPTSSDYADPTPYADPTRYPLPARPADPAPAADSAPAADPAPFAPPPSYDVEPVAEEADVEDILEETPDFLEETPEHDRLWFEQRPPRDFDFDK